MNNFTTQQHLRRFLTSGHLYRITYEDRHGQITHRYVRFTGKRSRKPHLIQLWDIKAQQSKSFHLARVLDITQVPGKVHAQASSTGDGTGQKARRLTAAPPGTPTGEYLESWEVARRIAHDLFY